MQTWWSAFTHQDVNENWTLEAEMSLPGKPAGPHFACPASEVTDKIFIDLKLPDGLGYVNKKRWHRPTHDPSHDRMAWRWGNRMESGPLRANRQNRIS
ncbi:hypothetical protein P4S64_19045 [Vibrio sp. M60_M31a]